MNRPIYFLIVLILFLSPTFLEAQDNDQNPNISVADTISPLDSIGPLVNVQAINELILATEELILTVADASSNEEWYSIDEMFTSKEALLIEEAEDFNSYNQYSLSKFFLTNIALVWENYRKQISTWQASTDEIIEGSVKNTNELLEQRKLLETAFNDIMDLNFTSLSSRVSNTIVEIDSAISKIHKNEEALILLQSRIVEQNFLCEKVLVRINKLNENMRGKTFSRTKPYLWNIQLDGDLGKGVFHQFERVYKNNSKSVSYYIESVTPKILHYIVVLFLVVFLVYFIRKRYIMLGLSNDIPGHVNAERVLIKHPLALIVSFMIILWNLFFPYIPLLLDDLLFLIVLISLTSVLNEFIDKTGKRVLSTLTILIILNMVEIIFWYFGDYSRFYLMIESGFSIYLIGKLHFVVIRNKGAKTRVILFAKKFIPFMLLMYIIAFLANILGYINLTVLLLKIGVRAAAITMVAFGYLRIIENTNFALLSLLNSKYPDFVLRKGTVIEKRLKIFFKGLLIFVWAEVILGVFELNEIFHEWLKGFLTYKLEVGTISVSLSNILTFVFILALTYIIVSFIKKIIEEEILRNIRLPRGVPAAISMVLRIFFVSVGVIFAISAAGIDMSSFGMLAGALGVGIGFGLQNIVQNFISGLILIFERPIQVGDTVEVNNLLGRVKDIGVRASNVVTYDGAEVVVPNSNLISNDLINWTLSDSRKRIEVTVGTAYGSDPNLVLELLTKVARDHPDVDTSQQPRALFDGFGDSSLNFRLLFWVTFEKGLGVRSDVAIGIYNILAENGITIPFPQVDLNVKELPSNEISKGKIDTN